MNCKPSLIQEAASELLNRRKARESLVAYSQYVPIPGKPASEEEDSIFDPIETKIALHHRLIMELCQRTSEKRHGRAMIFCPPGSAKSTYGSVVFPTWLMGKFPGYQIILTSYGSELAKKHGRKARQIVKSKEFTKVFNTEISKDQTAADMWSLTNKSEYMSGGIMSGLTGNRCRGILCDDPIKGRQEADSEVTRASVKNAYDDDLKTRLIPGGWIIIIQTRWHQDDLAGSILPENYKGESGLIMCQDGMEWEVLSLTAKCESENDPLGRKIGEYIWPEWFDYNHWRQFESNARTWNALYQQRPSPPEGLFFKPERINIIKALPVTGVKWVRAWDFAASKDKGDFTVGVKIGRTKEGRIIIAGMIRIQEAPEGVRTALKNTSKLDTKKTRIRIPQDPGQAGKSQVEDMIKSLQGFIISSERPTGSKEIRAEPLASQINAGNVDMLEGSWNNILIQEFVDFPTGRHDDIVDAASDGYDELNKMKVMTFDEFM